MKLPRRQFLHLAAGAAALPAMSRIASAQAYPARPVRLIVPFPAGGAVEETFEPGMTVTSAPSSVTMSASVRARMQTPSVCQHPGCGAWGTPSPNTLIFLSRLN